MPRVKKDPKPRNKTFVVCTNTDRKVKCKIVSKDDNSLIVDVPTGFQMKMVRKPKRKLYTYVVGTLEFVSDGWEVS